MAVAFACWKFSLSLLSTYHHTLPYLNTKEIKFKPRKQIESQHIYIHNSIKIKCQSYVLVNYNLNAQ